MTYIPYDPNVPQFTSDSLEESQPEMQNNFATLFQIFLKNHVSINDAVSPGNHTNIQLKELKTSPQTDVSQISIYNKNIETSTNEIFLRYQGNADEFAYTCYQIYGLNPIKDSKDRIIQIPYFTFLPGKILIYFGNFINVSQDSTFKISLFPPIAKKIISVAVDPSFLNSGSFFTRPIVQIVENKDGFFDMIECKRATEKGAVPPCYYFVAANIG